MSAILYQMIEHFDDGRSRSFFCKATVFIDIKKLEESLDEANQKIRSENIKPDEKKIIASILKDIIHEKYDNDQTK